MSNQPKFNAFVVSDKDGKPSFAKIGAAWENKSGGLNIRLEDEGQGDIYLFPQKERKPREKVVKPREQAVTNGGNSIK